MSDYSPADRPPGSPATGWEGSTAGPRQNQGFGKRTSLNSTPPPLPSQDSPPLQHNAPASAANPARRKPWPLQTPPPSVQHERTAERGTPTYNEQPGSYGDPDTRPGRHRTTSRFGAISYAAVGFLAGAAFWHAVGFWNLVHDAVFSGPRLEAGSQPQYATRPPVVRAFDEEVLRYANDKPTKFSPSRVVTGSIKKPAPGHVDDRMPVAAPARRQPAAAKNTAKNSWQPAVTKSPSQ